jgi:hypothetical protein
MDIKSSNTGNIKKIAIGTVSAIGICALTFSIFTNTAQSAVINKTESIPTVYQASSASIKPNTPKGYVKASYKVKLAESARKSTAKDMPAKDAAEIGAQDIWKLFGADLNGKTIEMSYNQVTDTQLRAQWQGEINIKKNLSYWFTVDAITGENLTTAQNKYWPGNVNVGFDKALNSDPAQYRELASKVAEKYQLVSGKIISAKYDGQGYTANNDGTASNPDISFIVTSDNGNRAQLLFSRYNQEFLQVSYDSCVKEMEAFSKKMEDEQAKKMQDKAKQKDQKNNTNSTSELILQEDK